MKNMWKVNKPKGGMSVDEYVELEQRLRQRSAEAAAGDKQPIDDSASKKQ